MVNFNLVSLLCLPFALTSAFVPAQTRSIFGQAPSFALPSSASIGKPPKQGSALFARPNLDDEVLDAIVKDLLLENGIDDVNSMDVVNIVKEPLNNPTFDGSLTRMDMTPDGTVEGALSAGTSVFTSTSFPMTSGFMTTSSCEWASIELGIEVVSLGLQAAGLPGGTGKRVAKILVGKAEKKLKKEMKKIVKDYFKSVNPITNAAGLLAVFSIIIGEVGTGDFLSTVVASLSWWDAIQVTILLTAYFISGGGGLAAKLAFMTPQIIDVVEAGIEVGNVC
jgi:hypothetical protein